MNFILEDNQPLKVVKRLTPEWNLFNFFIVQPFTYHQVSEVKTSRSPRLSINGWFHSDSVTIVPRYYNFPLISKIRHPILLESKNAITYETLLSWINPKYTVDEVLQEIQEEFVDKSEIALRGFLRNEKYNELATALCNINVWKRHFRPVLANYEYIPENIFILDENKEHDLPTSNDSFVPRIITDIFKLFYSEAFFLMLSNMTGIRLHKNVVLIDDDDDSNDDDDDDEKNDNRPDCVCTARGEIRRWQTEDFTLASSIAPEYFETKALDFMFFLNVLKNNETMNYENNDSLHNLELKNTNDFSSDSQELDEDYDSIDDIGTINLSDDSNFEEDDEDDEDDDNNDTESLKTGGQVIYIDDSSINHLLTIEPMNNCLNLVYRMRGTQRFTKYITSQNKNTPYNEISIVYYQEDSLPK